MKRGNVSFKLVGVVWEMLGEIVGLVRGFMRELGATSEILPWIQNTAAGRVALKARLKILTETFNRHQKLAARFGLEQNQVLDLSGVAVYWRPLIADASTAEILEVLGGVEAAQIPQVTLDYFLEELAEKEGGDYLFFVGGEAVHAFWDGSNWSLKEHSVEHPIQWRAGDWVVSFS